MDDMLDLIQDTAESLLLYDIQKLTPEATPARRIMQLRLRQRVQDAVDAAVLDGRRASHPEDLPGRSTRSSPTPTA